MACSECGKPFLVGDSSRSAANARRDPDAVHDRPYSSPPTAQAVPRSNTRRTLPDELDSNSGRWVAFGICLFLLVVVLAGIGFLVFKAQSEGGYGGPSTAPARARPGWEKDMKKDAWQKDDWDRQRQIDEEKARIEREFMEKERIEKERFEKDRFEKK